MLRDESYRRVLARIHQLKKCREDTSDLLRKVELTTRIHNLQTMLLITGDGYHQSNLW